jgi:hypothetical protein
MRGDGPSVVLAILGASGRAATGGNVADTSIHVDTDGLTEFAGNVGFYATEVDPADVSRSRQQFAAGVTFGVKNASGAVHVAKENYARALTTSLQNLTEFVEAARVLSEAAEKAAADFKSVDNRSAATIALLNQRLSESAQASLFRRGLYYGPYLPQDQESK